MLSENELKNMHGKEYVDSFIKLQSKFRLERLIDSIDLKPEYKVADFACGSGMLLPLVSDKVNEYVGVDFSKDFINAAEKNMEALSISNSKFVCGDIIDFCSLNQNAFDAAFAMDFSEHVYDKDWIKILLAIKGSLKPAGKLYIHTPNANFFLEKMKAKNFIVKQFPEHIAVRNPVENVFLIEDCGYTINKLKLIPHYNILRILHPFSFIPIVGKYLKARIFIEAIA